MAKKQHDEERQSNVINNLESLNKGLYTDCSPEFQPENTYRFALNAILENNEGENMQLSSEYSFEKAVNITKGYTCIGSCYIGNDEIVLFLVNGNKSEIGIYNKKNNSYLVWCSDADFETSNKLNFRIDKPIQSSFRMRRGCDKVIYWVDNYNVPRMANLSNISLYKNNNNKLSADRFSIVKTFNKIPICNKVDILENQGMLQPGTVSVLLQYCDEEKNSTQFVLEVSNIILYNDNHRRDFTEIDGSINVSQNEQFSEGKTKKAISLTFSNFDEGYSFYRLAFVHYGNNNLEPSEVFLSNIISTKQTTFVYNGDTSFQKTDYNYIESFNKNTRISSANTIAQKDNRLILGNTSGDDLNFNELQKLASKINVDCVVKKSSVNNVLDPHNTKNPTSKISGTGFIPGEVASLGIVWVFQNGIESPVFHIPGKNNKVSENHIYNNNVSGVEGIHPMKHSSNNKKSVKNNTTNYKYTQRENCNGFDYWGEDSNGDKLVNTFVRHHRFPTRKDIGVPLLVEHEKSQQTKQIYYSISFGQFTDEAKALMKECGQEGKVRNIFCNNPIKISFYVSKNTSEEDHIETEFYTDDPTSYYETKYWFDINGTVGIINKIKTKVFVGSYIKKKDGTFELKSNLDNLTVTNGKIELKEGYIKEESEPDKDDESVLVNVFLETTHSATELNDAAKLKSIFTIKGVDIVIEKIIDTESNAIPRETYILGVSLSNVELPDISLTGKKCVGYYIVKQERKLSDRTILDSGVVLPLWDAGDIKTSSLVSPIFSLDNNRVLNNYRSDTPSGVYQKGFSLLSPRHKFHEHTFDNFTHIVEQGYYKTSKDDSILTGQAAQNVNNSKTDNASNSYSAFKDEDGMTFKNLIRFQNMKFSSLDRGTNSFYLENDGNVDIYNLNPCEYGLGENGTDMFYNFDFSNKKLIFTTNKALKGLPEFNPANDERKYPYVYIYNNHSNFYQDFQSARYYKLLDNISTESTYVSFNGSFQVGALREYNTIYNNVAQRAKFSKKSWTDYALAGLAIVAGVLGAIFSGGTSLILIGAGLSILGGLAYGVAATIKTDSFNRAMSEHWEKGLKRCVTDYWGAHVFFQDWAQGEYLYYQDETIRWYSEIYGDIMFETDINISLRIMPKMDRNNFLKPFKSKMKNGFSKISPAKGWGASICTVDNTGSGGRWYWEDNGMTVKSDSVEELFFLNKFCKKNLDFKRNDSYADSGWEYRGIPMPTVYFVNNDYQNNRKVLSHYMIPFEYSFCSSCKEFFPQRFHWSESSYSEQLIDNYKIFKPNNYKDLDDQYGEINNIFVFNNQLYIHTTNGLWLQPVNYQEKVMNDVVTYIGTGEFGSLPAQLILNDLTGNSAGLQQRDAFVLTPYGYFFVCEKERKVYKFDGKLTDISLLGMSKWFKKNLVLYDDLEDIDYEYNNLPYHTKGRGFVLNYDYKNDRLLVTKRRYNYTDKNDKEGTSYYDQWTAGFSLKTNSWISFYSYIPDRYIQINDAMFLIKKDVIEKQNKHRFLESFDKKNKFIIEFVVNKSSYVNKIFSDFQYISKVYGYLEKTDNFIEEVNKTFNKLIVYNSYQCSSELEIVPKDKAVDADYMNNQIKDVSRRLLLDRTENKWSVNNFRNLYTGTENMFIENIPVVFSKNNKEFIDKILNENAFKNKEWYELDSFRDNYLVVRLIFDNFANENNKIVFYLEEGKENISFR